MAASADNDEGQQKIESVECHRAEVDVRIRLSLLYHLQVYNTLVI